MAGAMIPRVLTIAGSDSGGGAGIQADLKTFTALRVYGMSALTSITAQNTRGVLDVLDLPGELVSRQIEAVAQDIGLDAAKIGMLSNAEIIAAVAGTLRRLRVRKLVVDPVMRAKGGASLLRPQARRALIEHILPLALLVTPNLPEAEALTGRAVRSVQSREDAARRIADMGPRFVLIKGGHGRGELCEDLLYDGVRFRRFSAPRLRTRNTHGTGCTLSAAIAAYLARGAEVPEAVREAKAYVTGAIARSFPLGRGHGPLNHFWRTWGFTERIGA